jgi:hypothetical protein
MQMEIPVSEDSTLTSVRRRSQACLGYLFWVCVVLCLLWVANAVASLLDHWVALLHDIRNAVGLAVPVAGPDYWILGGVAALAMLAIAVLTARWPISIGTRCSAACRCQGSRRRSRS